MKRDDLVIRKPCQADWQRMRRLEQKRYCDLCEKHVHDLSAMTAAEARHLLASPPTSGLCVRYLHDDAGNIVFRPERLVPRAGLLRAKRMAAMAAAALPLGLAACGGGTRATMGEPRPMMGDIAVPTPPPATSVSPDQGWRVIPEKPEVTGDPASNDPQGCAIPQPPH